MYVITSGSTPPLAFISSNSSSARFHMRPFSHAEIAALYVITVGGMPARFICSSNSSAI